MTELGTSQYSDVIGDQCMCHGTLTFFTLEKTGLTTDFFGVFNYRTGTFLNKIIFREIARHPRLF